MSITSKLQRSESRSHREGTLKSLHVKRLVLAALASVCASASSHATVVTGDLAVYNGPTFGRISRMLSTAKTASQRRLACPMR